MKTNVLLRLDSVRARRELIRRAKAVALGVYQADITDDGKHIQLHWGPGEATSIALHDLLTAYLSLNAEEIKE